MPIARPDLASGQASASFLCLALLLMCAPIPTTATAAARKTTATTTKAKPPKVVKLDEYRRQVAADPDMELVDLEKIIPGIRLDLRYATRKNFMGRPLYGAARALLRRPVAERLLKVQASLAPRGLGLLVFDAYRPYSVTVEMWRSKKAKPIYLSPPSLGSRHNRGIAVDLALVDLKTGRPLPMPTDFDEFSPRAGHAYTQLDPARIANRRILKEVMAAHGFFAFDREWWHYSHGDWRRFDILDVPVEAVP